MQMLGAYMKTRNLLELDIQAAQPQESRHDLCTVYIPLFYHLVSRSGGLGLPCKLIYNFIPVQHSTHRHFLSYIFPVARSLL